MKRKAVLIWAARTSIVAALSAPVLIYLWRFRGPISADHQRWAEMGDFFAGIYTPILTMLTLAVLVVQVRLQSDLNRHTKDEAFVQQARADIQTCLQQLAAELDKEMDDGHPLRKHITEAFGGGGRDYLLRPEVNKIAGTIAIRHHKAFDSWFQFYSIIAGLKVHAYHPYLLTYTTSKQKAGVALSYGTCLALDSLLFSATKGNIKIDFEFAEDLSAGVGKEPHAPS